MNQGPLLNSYFHAVGKFVLRYAEMEATVFQALRVSTGLTNTEAKALLSGTRVRDAMSLIKRINEGRGTELSPWLSIAFSKLGEVTTARDKILHYGLQFNEESATVTDSRRTLPSRATTFRLSIEDLDDLEADITKIHACLNMFWLEARYPKSRAEMKISEAAAARAPWRYKQQPQGQNQPKKRQKTQAP